MKTVSFMTRSRISETPKRFGISSIMDETTGKGFSFRYILVLCQCSIDGYRGPRCSMGPPKLKFGLQHPPVKTFVDSILVPCQDSIDG